MREPRAAAHEQKWAPPRPEEEEKEEPEARRAVAPAMAGDTQQLKAGALVFRGRRKEEERKEKNWLGFTVSEVALPFLMTEPRSSAHVQRTCVIAPQCCLLSYLSRIGGVLFFSHEYKLSSTLAIES